MSSSVNEILKVYLGADENGGFQPVGCDARLKEAYPSDYAHKKEEIERYLSVEHTPDWSKRGLLQERDLFAEILKKRFPELDSPLITALANRFTYDWK